jgi:hypothetical protein
MALAYDTSPVGTTSAGANTMDPRIVLLIALMFGAGGRLDRRLFRDIDDIPDFILPHTFYSNLGGPPPAGAHHHSRQAVLQWLHDRLRSEDGSRLGRLDAIPLLLAAASQGAGQAVSTTTTSGQTQPAPSSFDPMTALALALLLGQDHY